MSSKKPLLAGLAASALLFSSLGFADERAARVAGADALFREGEQLFGAGNIHAACEKFAASQNLDPALGTLINLAICHAREGKTGSAYVAFKDALAQATARGQSQRVDAIQRELNDLEPRLSQVTLDWGSANADSVKVDGRLVDPSAARAALPLDPGSHSFEFLAPGKKPQTVAVTLAAGPSSQTGPVPTLADASSERVDKSSGPPPPSSTNTGRTIGFAVGGAGIVALAVGAGFGVAAASKKSDADASCQGRYGCPREGYDANNAAHTDATISTIAFGVGLVAVGVGTYLVLTARAPRNASAYVRFAPALGGLRLNGAF
jgi:hypothetical protein